MEDCRLKQSWSRRIAFRRHLNIMLNNLFDSTLRHSSIINSLSICKATAQTYLHVESSDRLDRRSCAKLNIIFGGNKKKKSVHRVSALYFLWSLVTYNLIKNVLKLYIKLLWCYESIIIWKHHLKLWVNLIMLLLYKLIQVLEIAHLQGCHPNHNAS